MISTLWFFHSRQTLTRTTSGLLAVLLILSLLFFCCEKLSAKVAENIFTTSQKKVDSQHEFNHGRVRELRVKQLPKNIKLPSAFVNDIEVLSDGTMLFSTNAGVKIFTGYEYIPLLPESHENASVLNGTVYQSMEDSKGNIWFATDNGLYFLKRDGRHLFSFRHESENENSLANDNVRKIFEDSHGSIWFASLIGITRYSPKTNTFKRYLYRPDGEKKTYIRNSHSLIELQGRLWIGSVSGLYYIDLNSLDIHAIQGDVFEKYVTSVIAINDHKLWLAVDTVGIFQFDINTQAIEKYNNQQDSKIKLRSNFIWHLYQDKEGKIWIGYWNDAIQVVDLDKKQVFEINHYANDISSLPSPAIRVVTEDSDGIFWIGTAGGVAFFDPGTYAIESLRHIPGRENTINNSSVLNVFYQNNIVWMGTERGLEKYNRITSELTHYYQDKTVAEDQAKGAIWKIVPVGDDHLLIGRDFGLDLFNIHNGHVKYVNDFRVRSGKVVNAGFFDIQPSDNGWFYLSSNASTIHRYHPLTNERELIFDSLDSPLTLDVEYFLAVREIEKDRYWIGSTSGLFLIDKKKDLVKKFNVRSENPLSSNIINDLLVADKNTVWIATGTGGINQLIINGNELIAKKIFTFGKNADNNIISNLLKLDGDKLWFTTVEKIGYLNIKTGDYKYFPWMTNAGQNYVEGGRFVDENGIFYLGGSELSILNPQLFQNKPHQHNVNLMAVEKLHQPLDNFFPLSHLKQFEFFPEDSLISFYFSCGCYAYPQLANYEYRLKGVDAQWIPAGNINHANYTHLPSGEYEFQVRAFSINGDWETAAASYPLIIHPPFWKSDIAYGIYLVLCLSLFTVILHFRRIKNKKEQAAVEAIRQSESRLKDVLWGSGDELWQWNLKSNLILLTNNINHHSSTWDNAVEYESIFNLIHPDDQVKAKTTLERYLQGEKSYYETQYRIYDEYYDNWRWVLSRGRVVEYDEQGLPLTIAGTRKDISELKNTENQLRQLANYDQLTDLPNRSFFHEHLTHAIHLAARFKERVALLFFDLDGFKRINDSLGHSVGDQLLQAVASRLRNLLDETGYIARLGGDEFTIILERVVERQDILVILEQVSEKLNQPFQLNGQNVITSVSIGVAIYPEDGKTPDILLKNADIAMYEAKRKGKRQYCFFESQMNEILVKRLNIETELSLAIVHNQFETYYQPRVCVADNQLIGFEALIRWHHPQKGFISPNEFIPIAEETGQILQIGAWVLKDACQQCAVWHRSGNKVRVSVNISALQFQQTDLFDNVEFALSQSGLPAKYLELEITEGTLIHNIEHTRSVILKLKSLGINIALDDFGTGFSSLAYLQQLPLDVLKIDRVFINQLRSSKKSVRLSRAIINMAHSLDLEVVAEGIEEASQLAFLKEAGCEEYQGYLYGKPVPACDIRFD
ncbi:EAL domain-containing protein [Aliikangiella maris]|uniref:EAL domain-containing protein n=2 Tax=Aliikangiella maris TaxID=3162458 RepID=A0ABV2BQ53_9GAMM